MSIVRMISSLVDKRRDDKLKLLSIEPSLKLSGPGVQHL